MVVTYANGTIEDDYFEVSAGNNSIGQAHRVILCLEDYAIGGSVLPFDLTPEIGSFAPGGVWHTPGGLIIADADLSSLSTTTLSSGWYTYTINSGGCEITSGVYLQANNTGLTTTYVICETYEPFEMLDFMQGAPDTIGQWYDSNFNLVPGGIYNPATMDDALFTYLIDNLSGCQPLFRAMFVDEQTQRTAGSSASIMVCQGSSPFNLLNQLGDSPNDGGIWSGPSTISPAGSDIFNPSTMQQGVYTYTINSVAPCATRTSSLTIAYTNDNPSGLSASVQLCSTSGTLDMMGALNGNPLAGGTWTNGAGQVVDGVFAPGSEPAGNYEYYYPNLGCNPANSILSISVEAPVNAGSNGTAITCQTDNSFNLNSMLSSNATPGGSWLSAGNTVSNIYVPVNSGSFNFTYRVDAQTCPDDQASFTVYVQPAVAAPLSQTIYLCSLGLEVDLRDYFGGLANVFFEDQSGALVSSQFNPANENSTILQVVNPSGNTCPDQDGTLTIEVLQPVIDDAVVPVDLCRSNSQFDLNTTLPPAAVGMGTWLDVTGNPHSNLAAIDFIGTESYVYEVIQPIDCGGEHLQIDLITYTPNDAGSDVSEVFCYTDNPAQLTDLLPTSQLGLGEWYFNGAVFNSPSFDPGSDASGTYIYRIPANGPCPADEALANLNVQMGINYTAGSDVHVCAGSGFQTLGGNPAPGAVYSWSPSSGLSNVNSPQPSVEVASVVNQTSTVIYTVFADDGICTFTDYVSVTVEPNPVINLNGSYDICLGEHLALSDVVTANCVWTPANLFADITATNPTIQPTASVYIGVEATSDFGCTANAYSQINVNPLPVLITDAQPISGCQPIHLAINPTSASQYIDHMVWNVSGVGTILGDSLHIDLNNAGVYDVEAIAVSESGCISTSYFEEIAEVYPSPVAHFTVSPGELTTLQPEAEFTNYSTGAVAYQWSFDGLDESAEMNTTYVFPNEQSDNFFVCLIATNSYGCTDTTCRYIYMDAEYVVFAPNAFTPDADGDNDTWKPVIRGFDTTGYELSIFNRWGDRVYFSQDPNEPWTGDIENGGFFGQNEVYNWRLKLLVTNSAEEIYFTGSIVLIR
jgi:gliding motility-associated-like protein